MQQNHRKMRRWCQAKTDTNRRRRRTLMPTNPMPAISIAQLAGSGTVDG
jgi:hypothetical protein